MSYICDLVFTITKDRVALPGLFYRPKKKDKKIGIIYLHGLNATFYKERTKKLAQSFTNKGISFLSFATRGLGPVSSFKITDKRRKRGYSRKYFGTAFEKFEDCIHDIEAMTDFLKDRKYRKIFLVGHSTGANKAAYYVIKKRNPKMDGVVFLAPVADRPALKEELGRKFNKAVRVAEEMVKKRKGDSLMPFDLINGFMSAKRFLSLAIPNTLEDVFTYRNGMNRLSRFSRIKIPLMVVYGENDQYLHTYKAKDLLKLFKEKSKNSKHFEGALIKNADHGFGGKEGLVAKKIIGFIAKT